MTYQADERTSDAFFKVIEDLKRYFENSPEWEIVKKRVWGERNIKIQILLGHEKSRTFTIMRRYI